MQCETERFLCKMMINCSFVIIFAGAVMCISGPPWAGLGGGSTRPALLSPH